MSDLGPFCSGKIDILALATLAWAFIRGSCACAISSNMAFIRGICACAYQDQDFVGPDLGPRCLQYKQ